MKQPHMPFNYQFLTLCHARTYKKKVKGKTKSNEKKKKKDEKKKHPFMGDEMKMRRSGPFPDPKKNWLLGSSEPFEWPDVC